MMRVIVTGSREWSDADAVRAALDRLLAEHGMLLVIHGACPTGADAMADRWARDRQADGAPVLVSRWEANWGAYGRAAGMRRNAEMVDAGADVCLAFFQPAAGNRGTSHCAKLARRAGIPVTEFRPPA